MRYRKNHYHGGAAASVDIRKQKKIIVTAHYFLQQYPHYTNARFDVIAIQGESQQINWIKDAFQVG